MNRLLVIAFIPIILSLGIIPALQSDVIPNAEAAKAKGNSLTETNSKKICGDKMCSEVSKEANLGCLDKKPYGVNKIQIRNTNGWFLAESAVHWHGQEKDHKTNSVNLAIQKSHTWKLKDIHHPSIEEGEQFWAHVHAVAGNSKSADENFRYDPSCNLTAFYQISGTTLSIKISSHPN